MVKKQFGDRICGPTEILFVLSRDGTIIMTASEIMCWQYIHRNHPYSVAHALQYEGYAITEQPATDTE
jgi:hypothetical protein